ncbi:DUF1345 domain-containing protein [Deinococcus saxicola]|uniref:hypothetical protein n=1 Tax=Deinococcus saxicola TaxID=249406 RepID=UPI0039EF97BA
MITASTVTEPPAPESLWPARLAILAVIGLNLLLSEYLTLGPRWLLPALELGLLLPLIVVRTGERRRLLHVGHQAMDWSQGSRLLAVGPIALLHLTNLSSLTLLIISLLHGSSASGVTLLAETLNIWMTNIFVFSLWYWEMDQGGPLRRSQDGKPPDFLFPQVVNPAHAPPGWRPEYLDYLFVAFTNAAAFSPTDTMPLTRRAKALMLVQSSTSILTVVLVASRAVSVLK